VSYTSFCTVYGFISLDRNTINRFVALPDNALIVKVHSRSCTAIGCAFRGLLLSFCGFIIHRLNRLVKRLNRIFSVKPSFLRFAQIQALAIVHFATRLQVRFFLGLIQCLMWLCLYGPYFAFYGVLGA